MKTVFAQGDVILERVEDIEPKPEQIVKPEKNGAIVLAEGEVTGHLHAIYGGAIMFRDDALARGVPEDLYIGHVKVASAGAVLEHGTGPGQKGDHDPVEIPAGTYRARRQREYHAGEARRVAD